MSDQDEINELRKLTTNMSKNINQLEFDKTKLIMKLTDEIKKNEALIENNNLLIEQLENRVRNVVNHTGLMENLISDLRNNSNTN